MRSSLLFLLDSPSPTPPQHDERTKQTRFCERISGGEAGVRPVHLTSSRKKELAQCQSDCLIDCSQTSRWEQTKVKSRTRKTQGCGKLRVWGWVPPIAHRGGPEGAYRRESLCLCDLQFRLVVRELAGGETVGQKSLLGEREGSLRHL